MTCTKKMAKSMDKVDVTDNRSVTIIGEAFLSKEGILEVLSLNADFLFLRQQFVEAAT